MKVLLLVIVMAMLTTSCGLAGSFKMGFQDKKGNTYVTKLDLTPDSKGIGFTFIGKDGKEYTCSYADNKVMNGGSDEKPVVEIMCLIDEDEA